MLSACKPTWHDIRLTPDGAVMEREISQQFGPEELERVALLYGQGVGEEMLAKFEKQSYVDTALTGRFRSHMPDDSRNSGVLLYCDSPLGSASMYTERFGGRNDIAAMLHNQERAFHLVWDIVLLLLDDLVGSSPDYPALRSFLDTTARTDAWDLTLEMTISDLGKDSMTNLSWREDTPEDVNPMLMRALHFLESRGYLRLDDFYQQLTDRDKNDEDLHVALKLVGTSIGRRMELGEKYAMPAAFSTLLQFSDEELEDKIEQVLNNDERVVRLLVEFRKERDGMHMSEPSKSMDVLVKQAFLFDFDLLDIGGDARRVSLYLPVEPYQTNGAWLEANETDGEVSTPDEVVILENSVSYVEWSYPLADADPRGGDLPQVVFAFWAEPAEQYQLNHFGQLVLEKEDLENQCRWRENLDTPLQAEWDAFIEDLRPGTDLGPTLRNFRFSVEAEAEHSGDPNAIRSGIASEVIRHLADAVQSKQQSE
jgi:hypothetical protein